MRKAVLIIGGLAVVLVAGLITVAWLAVEKVINQENTDRTAAARAKRWAKEDSTEQKEDATKINNDEKNGKMV